MKQNIVVMSTVFCCCFNKPPARTDTLVSSFVWSTPSVSLSLISHVQPGHRKTRLVLAWMLVLLFVDGYFPNLVNLSRADPPLTERWILSFGLLWSPSAGGGHALRGQRAQHRVLKDQERQANRLIMTARDDPESADSGGRMGTREVGDEV